MPREAPGGFLLLAMLGGLAALAAILVPISLLPVLAVGALLILVVSFAFAAEDVLKLVPFGIALSPMVALVGFRFAGAEGTVVLVGFLALMIITSYRRQLVAVFGLPELAIAIFAFGLFISAIHGEGISRGSTILRSLLPFFLAWVVARSVTREKGNGETLWWTAVIFLLVNAPLGILEALTTSDLVVFPQTGLVEIGQTGFARPNGFLSTDIDFALSMTLCVAVVVGGPAVERVRSWSVPVALLGSLALVLASFRTGWLVLAIIWLAWLSRRSAQTWLIAAAIVLVAIPLLVQPVRNLSGSDYVQERVVGNSNVTARETAFDQAWELFKEEPILGVGLNGFQVDPMVLAAPGEVVTPHNLWLGVLAETGLVGAIGLLLLAVTTGLNCFKLARRRLTAEPGGRGAIWGCLAILPFSLTFQVLLVPTSIMLIGFLLGAVRGLALSGERTAR